MAYIGRYVGTDKTTKTLKLDSLQSQFNGAQTVFSLKSDGTSVYPSTPQSLVLSLNGVVQEPGTAYTISQDTVTFTSAPASNSEFFGVLNGNQADFGYNFGQLNVMDVATFSSNVTVLGTLTVGNSTITINTTTLTAGNTSLNSTGVTIGTTTVTATGLAATNPANTTANGVVTTDTQSFAGDKTFINNMTVTGNLTVLGTAVTLNSENVLIKDNILTLSSNVTGAPVLDAGIEVNRGTSANVTLKWNETSDIWQLTNDGTNYGNILTTLSSTGVNASALSTGTVPLARLTSANSSANGVVDTTTQTFAGDKTFTGISAFSANVNFDSGTLFVDATNNRVGIGVTTPQKSLVVSDAGNIGFEVSPNDAAQGYTRLLNYNRSTSQYTPVRYEGSTHTWYANTSGTDRIMDITANGDVAIGSTTARTRFTVVGRSFLGGGGSPISLGSAGNNYSAVFTNSDSAYGVAIAVASSGNGYLQAQRFDGTATAYDLVLQPAGGKVGIGGSPNYTLEVQNGTADAGIVAKTSNNSQDSYVSSYNSHASSGNYIQMRSYGNASSSSTTLGQSAAKLNAIWSSGDAVFAIGTQGSTALVLGTSNAERMRIDSSGHIRPGTDNAQDFGSTSYRWRNVYTADLHLSNRDHHNDVDGTWGDWTIQEGEEKLYLLNRRNRKVYEFVLKEVN